MCLKIQKSNPRLKYTTNIVWRWTKIPLNLFALFQYIHLFLVISFFLYVPLPLMTNSWKEPDYKLNFSNIGVDAYIPYIPWRLTTCFIPMLLPRLFSCVHDDHDWFLSSTILGIVFAVWHLTIHKRDKSN